jgi:hypothetical protein
MYLKEDSVFISVGPVNGYKYVNSSSYDIIDNLYQQNHNEQLHENAEAHAHTQSPVVNRTLLIDNEIESDKKCLFYTFFFGIIGYLLYYIFKDTM